MKTIFYIGATLLFICLFFSTGCKKGELLSKGQLEFSADTVVFDTVFTTIGSTTKRFKFYNRNNKPLKISEIRLMGGSSSAYRMNVDGISGTLINDITIEANDSLYVFVEVTLDPNNLTNPMVIEDDIRFTTNGNQQFVHLAAWGQDAYFHYKDTNEGIWPNDKPHVIYGYAGVDSSKTLIIQQGTDIYLHKNALLYVYKGQLFVNGTLNEPVTFQGDRLEMEYDDVAGQYYGIYFQEALPSVIDYAIIKNATSGVHVYSEDPSNPPAGYTVELKNSIITNCARYGVFIFSGATQSCSNALAKVKAENCIIAKNAYHALLVLEGGVFNFNHCHLLGYSENSEQVPAIGLSNYYTEKDPCNSEILTTFVRDIDGTVTNSVIYGDLDHELAFDTLSNPGGITFNFQYDLIRSAGTLSGPSFQNNLWNQDPQFKDISEGNFEFWSTSPLHGNGNSLFPTSNGLDIKGTPRNPTSPDIGAYEL